VSNSAVRSSHFGMKTVSTAVTRLNLPRPLINRLLHAAQSLPDAVHWGLIGADRNSPAHCYPIKQLDSTQFALAREKLDKRGETLFAIYRSDPADMPMPMPDIQEIKSPGIEAPYLLSVSLGTKGVLQLRGWRIEGGQLSALDVGISED